MPVYSHSKLATYENCPQKYKLQYIDRVEIPEGGDRIEAFLGSRVHSAGEDHCIALFLLKVANNRKQKCWIEHDARVSS